MSPKQAKKRGFTTWIVLVVLAGAGAFGYQRYSAAHKDQGPKFESATADRGPVIAKITATGTLSALVTVQVGSQVSGRLQEILVDFNSPVKKGQVIARIDRQLFQASLEQAKANAAAAKANVVRSEVQAVEADRQYQRTKSLAEQKLVSAAEGDTAQATADAARAQVEASKAALQQTAAALHQAQVNLDYTTIMSPINGVVISRSVDVGQTVAASLSAPTLFVIAEDLRKMQVDASVSEADVGKLRPGMDATFTVDAFPGDRFHGSIRQIRNAAQTLQNVVTYDAVIDVANPDLKLRPGMTAGVTFIYAERADVLRAPNSALRFRPTPELIARMRGEKPGEGKGAAAAAERKPPGGGGTGRFARGAATEDPTQRTVWVLRGPKPESIVVHTGVSDGTLTEITEGKLSPGDKLVTDVIETPGSASGSGSSPGGAASSKKNAFRMF
jgi:HlyD family secretion protein